MEMLFLIDTILTIVVVAMMGVVCGLLSYFLDYCFWPGSIFKGYLPFIAKLLMPKADKDEVMMLKADARPQAFVDRATDIMLFKLLGGCVYCFNVWLTFISFAIINSCLHFGWYYIFVYTTISHFFLRKIID